MRHEDAYAKLQDYVDGALDGSERLDVEAHLDACLTCRSEVDGTASLISRLGALPVSIEPPADLWPSIDARLGAPGIGAWSLWSARYGLAAAALLLVVVSVTVTLWLVGRGSVPSGELITPAAYTQFLETEQHYVTAVQALEEELALARQRLAPETVALIERNLRIIDDAIRETRAALAADPANADIVVILSGVYRTKLELLQQANRMAAG